MEENSALFNQANSEVEAMNGFVAGGGDRGFSKNTIDKSNDTLTFGLVNPTTSKLNVSLMGMNSGITAPVVNPAPTVPTFFGVIVGIAPFVGPNSICIPNNTMYLSNLGSDNITVFDLNLPGGPAITTIALPLGFGPTISCYCPVNNQIYVGSAALLQVIRIDCSTNTIIGAPIVITGLIDPAANGFIYNSVKNSMYAISNGDTLIEINCTTNTQVSSVLGALTLVYSTFNPLLNRIYIANFGTNNLDIFDCSTNLFLPSVALPLAQPIGIVYCSFNNSVYVSEQGGAQNIVQVNCNTLAIGVPIPSGVNVPRGLAYNPINNLIYIGGTVSTNYSVLDVASNTIGAPIATPNNPTSVLYDQNNNTVWFVDFAVNNISNITPVVAPSIVVTLQGGVTPAEIFNDLQGKPLFFSGLKMILSDLNQLFNNMTVQYTSVTGKINSSQLQPTNNVSPSNRNSNIVDITDFEFAADTNSQVSFDMEPLSTMTMAFSLRRQVSNVSFDSPNNNSVEKRENVRISGNPILDILLVQDEEEYQRKKSKN